MFRTSVDQGNIAELEAIFTSCLEKVESKDFLAGFISYLRFIEDTPSIRAVARKIMTSNPSFATSAVSQLYKGLQKAWEENYSPIEIVWADMHSPIVGGKSKYGLPMSFGDLQYSRSTARIFHNQLLSEIDNSAGEVYFENFDNDRGVLVLGGKEVVIGKKTGVENNQVRLLATLLKDPSRTWFTDELVEDWEGVENPNYKIPRNRFYDAAHKLNTNIELATGVSDFVNATTKKIRINPKYWKEK